MRNMLYLHVQREKAATLRRLHGATVSPTRTPAPSVGHTGQPALSGGHSAQTAANSEQLFKHSTDHVSTCQSSCNLAAAAASAQSEPCTAAPVPAAAEAMSAADRAGQRRHAALRQRMAFEDRNCGGFQRVYPVPESWEGASAQMAEYADCAVAAAAHCEQHHSKRMRALLDDLAAKQRQAKARF